MKFFQGIHPELLNKWWFKRNEMKDSNENMKLFVETIPPEVISWIIMTIIASFILVIAINSTTKPVINQSEFQKFNFFNHPPTIGTSPKQVVIIYINLIVIYNYYYYYFFKS